MTQELAAVVQPLHPSTAQAGHEAPADWLDQLLREQATQAAALPADEFCVRVLEALPSAPAQRLRWDAALLLQWIGAVAVGLALAVLTLVMPDAVTAVAQMGQQLQTQGPQVLMQGAVLQPVMLVLVLVLGVVWWSWQQVID